MKLTLVILSALLGAVSLAAPLPSAEEKKITARQNPLPQVVDIASGILLPADLKNSGIDKLPGELEGGALVIK
ncbi:hypothetical protein PVAR5_8534 [Paecilomyces variotii No. 5]|uniref:Uncharacterized protein n=1 Tax=Byssochlamys spectabilis (strain No. 5 / NBRC 109023) TaxID=1356009 RepID=V5GFS0_BYSSN|nr:hypothetical protein PVAR5_8534 [Paecilomyces variotii No. 5]